MYDSEGENSTLNNYNIALTFDGCVKSVKFVVDKGWKKFRCNLSEFECPSYIKNLKFIFGKADIFYLDNVQLEGPNESLINPGLKAN